MSINTNMPYCNNCKCCEQLAIDNLEDQIEIDDIINHAVDFIIRKKERIIEALDDKGYEKIIDKYMDLYYGEDHIYHFHHYVNSAYYDDGLREEYLIAKGMSVYTPTNEDESREIDMYVFQYILMSKRDYVRDICINLV